jgi:cbb3-type cytochrome oxidase subunit 3
MFYKNSQTIKILIIIVVFIVFGQVVYAANLKDAFTDSSNTEDAFLDRAATYAGYDINTTSIDPIIGTIIQAVLSLLGVIFLILMIYGGYLWMTAKGNEEQVTRAKELIIAAVTGLVIIVAAYAISYFIISKFSSGTLANP